MKTLAQLVKFKNAILGKTSGTNVSDQIQSKINELETLLDVAKELGYSHEIVSTVDYYNDLLMRERQIVDNYKTILDKIDSEISNLVQSKLSHVAELDENFLEPTKTLPTDELVYSTIQKYCDWRYPCLTISPRSQIVINSMVAGDPLYLTSNDTSQLVELIKNYNDLYQRRLRLYKVTDRKFTALPQNQFGFILCWDNLNYLTQNQVNEYLESVFLLLRPGGVFMFSYENCEFEGSAHRAETFISGYNTYTNIKQSAQDIGYEILNNQNINTGIALNEWISWIEIKKPGDLISIKRSQSLAEVIEK